MLFLCLFFFRRSYHIYDRSIAAEWGIALPYFYLLLVYFWHWLIFMLFRCLPLVSIVLLSFFAGFSARDSFVSGAIIAYEDTFLERSVSYLITLLTSSRTFSNRSIVANHLGRSLSIQLSSSTICLCLSWMTPKFQQIGSL